jgi:quinol monooxygenase YgiN
MAEVRVIARFVARKGKEDQLRILLQSMLDPTHAEPGCKAYELYESDSHGRFYLYERWESQATLDQHAASPHFKQLEQTAPELVKEPFEVNILKTILAASPARTSHSRAS